MEFNFKTKTVFKWFHMYVYEIWKWLLRFPLESFYLYKYELFVPKYK